MLGSWMNYLTGQNGTSSGESQVIDTFCGKVRGKVYTLPDGKKVEAFLGIPYAEAERFERPTPIKPWNTILDCTQWGERCPHTDLLLEMPFLEAAKGENCLNLNIFAPTWKPGTDQPNGFAVMFFIHGGGFTIHSSSHYGDYGICKALCPKDVIVVTINYRLGYFGFLSTDDEHYPGNLGLWDQAEALKWVKENIVSFGGDPDNITVFGQSAGGASCDYLCLSPYTRDLFQKVIPMAGTAAHTFAIVDRAKTRQKCLEFAISIGFKPPTGANKSEVNKVLMNFLRHQPHHKLESALLTAFGFLFNDNVSIDIVPVIDGDFLPKKINILRTEAPKKTIMSGSTKYEGLFLSFRPHKTLSFNESCLLLHQLLQTMGYPITKEIMDKMYQVYLEGGKLDDKRHLTKAAINMISDGTINFSQNEYNRTMLELGHTVYQYCFEYCNKKNMGLLGHAMAFRGATHCSELAYLFHRGLLSNFHPNQEDLVILEMMTTMWTNFAKYGNPNGKDVDGPWQPLSLDNLYKFYKIDLKPEFSDNIFQGRLKKWREILPQKN